MANVQYRVPYQIAVRAHDLGSGKSIVNLFYARCNVQTGTPPAYGAAIAGGGSTATTLANFVTLFAGLRALLNENYETIAYVMRPVLGKKYSTVSRGIAGLTSSLLIRVSTGTPHGLLTGDIVFIYGVTTPAGANGQWVVTVISPTSFDLVGSTPGAVWSGDGYWQLASGINDLLFGDSTEVTSADPGGTSGDALPLIATASVRRINAGVGRHFRSRFSLSPWSESDQVNGRFTTAQLAVIQAALATFAAAASWQNGGTDASSKFMEHIAFSQQIALGLASPFTSADAFTRTVNSMSAQPNLGSLVRRKPRLTAPIT